jgi:hypothetical protein
MHQEQPWFDLMGGLHAVHGQANLACHRQSSSVNIRLGSESVRHPKEAV